MILRFNSFEETTSFLKVYMKSVLSPTQVCIVAPNKLVAMGVVEEIEPDCAKNKSHYVYSNGTATIVGVDLKAFAEFRSDEIGRAHV